jgi:hypothetical protein
MARVAINEIENKKTTEKNQQNQTLVFFRSIKWINQTSQIKKESRCKLPELGTKEVMKQGLQIVKG